MRLPLVLLAALPLLVSSPAGAVGPRAFTLDTLDKLSGGDLKGVSVGSDGTVRAGWTLGNVPLQDATAIFATLPLADGSVLVGTSPSGKVFKIAGDQATLFADTKELAVTSLVQAQNGTIYAATIPSGKIFKIAQGKADVHATLADAEHVWALALDKSRTALFAATGPQGKLFRVEASGASSVFFDSEEPHLVSVAVDDKGEVYAGSSGKAMLYKISGPGRATVLQDFPGEEVKAIAVAPGGWVYVVANEYGAPPEPPRRSPAAGRVPPGPSTAGRVRPGKGRLFRFDALGRPEKMMEHTEFHYLSLALDDKGVPHVGTGDEGRVYSVDDAHMVKLVADSDERQVGGLAFVGGKWFVGSSDPAVFHRVISIGGPDSVWTSKVLDAGLRARYGHLSFRTSGQLEVSTRTGNVKTPDATWSAWSAPLAQNAVISSPPGRYIQVRARWARDPKASLEEVSIPFVTDNVRPVVTEVNAQQRGVTRDSKEGLQQSGGELPKHDPVVKITWKVDNPDQDQLRFKVQFRRENQTIWRDLTKADEVVTKTDYDWDTQALPEGKYRVRVEASDEGANPHELAMRHTMESGTVLVDNTPPAFRELTVAQRRLRARIVDGMGPILKIEMAIDGKLDWKPLTSADGILDTAEESVDTDLSKILGPGPHIIAVRAYDAAGNFVVQEIESP
jgi:hypothetical protein